MSRSIQAFAALLVLSSAACAKPGPEALIKRNVVKMTHAAEQKDLGAVMEEISDRFRGDQGLSKQELKGVLAGQLLRGAWVRIFTTDLEVKLRSPSTADFSGKFIFGRSAAKELKDLARDSELSRYQIDATLEKERDGEWRFVTAQYRQIP